MTSASSGDPGEDGRPPRRREDLQAQLRATRSDLEAQVRARREAFDAANQKIQARTGRNLILAVLIGLVLGGLLLGSLLVVKEAFLLFGAILVAIGVHELATSLRQAGRDVPRIPAVVAAVAMVPLSYYLGTTGQLLGLLAGVVLISAWRVIEGAIGLPGGRALGRDLLAGVLVLVYVPFLGSFAVLLAAEPGGQWWVLAFLVLAVAGDTGAYASGLLWGKHPMAPRISPKKTWEGLAGSVVVVLVAGVLLSVLLLGLPWWAGLLFGAVIVATATIGDLAESMIKRDIGIKDMSSLLPGHGGLLDRLDSILPSAPAAYGLFLLLA